MQHIGTAVDDKLLRTSFHHGSHHTLAGYVVMLNKNTLGVKKVRGQSEATMVI